MSDNDFFKDLVPSSTSIDVSRVPNANFYIKLSLNQRGFWFNAESVRKFDITTSDRVGFLWNSVDNDNKLIMFIYFTNSTLGTLQVKKYKKSAYRCNNFKYVIDIAKRLELTTDASINVYINDKVYIDRNINGKQERCYLITTKVSERDDLDDFKKEYITKKYQEFFKQVKQA